MLALLLLSQGSIAFAPVQAAATAAPGSAAPPGVSFSPHYLILGQLDGSQVVQSQRPRSVPLAEGVSYAATYYTAKDLQNAYNVTGMLSQGYGGRGETIAIIDAYGDPTIRQDLAAFDRAMGLPPANFTIVPVGPYTPAKGITFGWDAETALDVEAAHAAAPYARINLVVAANASNALFEAVKTVVDGHLGDVVSMSWGLGENTYGESGFSAAGFLNYAYLDYYFQKGAAEGMTFLASSGDQGAFDGTTTVTADFPATSPFVTGVGGTSLYMAGSGGSVSPNSSAAYQGESAWSVSPQYVGSQGVSSGGGYSVIFAQPHYQAGAVASGVRSAPDVAADANPYTGFVIVLEGAEYAIGGTSLSAPLWAGMAADLDQYAGRQLGLLTPSLYSVYGDKAEYDAAFHQVASGFNGAYQAGPGYNLVTGMGTPDLPYLAADIKNQSQGMTVGVTTSRGAASSAPGQYTYGEKFTVMANASTSSGPVTSGTFDANILGPGGRIATIPLYFDGLYWTGSYTPAYSDPAGSWTVEVYGASGPASGYGMADVSVGDSLAIAAPAPYPFVPTPVAAGKQFSIEAVADAPNGTAISNAGLTAHLLYQGSTISDVSLASVGGGFYQGEANITSSDPQGSYTLVVDSPGVGRVFSYFYVGEAVTGVILPPLDGPTPSAAPGQETFLLARSMTADGIVIFNYKVTSLIYTLAGTLMASVTLRPAPNRAQFGDFNFFGYNQANFTVPANLTQGFYKVQFLSSYRASGAEAQLGNFTTGLYVSGSTLNYTASAPATVYEGESVRIEAKVMDSTGSGVDSGVFFATLIPSGYVFESYAADALGYTGAPMQYNSTLGAWVGEIQVPSPLTSYNSFVGNLPALPAGPWTVYVSGESAGFANVAPSNSYVDVLPYIYYPNGTLSSSNIASAPLVVANGSGYMLSGIGRGSLAVSGVHLTLTDVNIGTLVVTDASVSLVGSQVGTVTATGSNLSLLSGTQVGRLNSKSTAVTAIGSYYGGEAAPNAPDYPLYAVAAVAVVALVAAVLANRRRGPTSAPPQV